MALIRTCKSCGQEFLLNHHVGRPKERCEACQPVGCRLTKTASGVKLRRLTPSITTDGRDLGA
jgi:hypothetical protein